MAEVHVPDNEFTRMIAQASERNKGRVESSVTAGDLPQARSAALGRMEVPLTADERAELDAKARALGIMPEDESAEGTNYATREEAEEAGRPVERVEASLGMKVAEPRPYMGPSTREFIGRPEQFPRLPDFTKPGIIDLGRGVIYLDGLEFPISEADLVEFRRFVVTTVHEDLTARLNAALAAVTSPKEVVDGPAPTAAEDVQPVSEAEGTGAVQPTQ